MNENKFFEKVYIIFLILVLVRQFLTNTVWNIQFIARSLPTIVLFFGVLVFVKVLSDWKNMWGWRDIVIAIISVGLIAVSNFYVHHEFVFEFVLLVMGAKGVDYKKILKIYLITVSILLTITVFSSLLGAIDNLVFYRDELSERPRYALGFYYVVYLCAHIFYIGAVLFFIREKDVTYIEILLVFVLGVAMWITSEGKNSFICIVILCIGALMYKLGVNLGVCKFLSVIFMPLLTIVSFIMAMTYKYWGADYPIIDEWLGYRPSMDSLAFERFDITLWGQSFFQDVYGGQSGKGFPVDYFFIDCSYVSILLRMGLISIIAILLMWSVISYKNNKVRGSITSFILCLIAFHCFMENNLLNISFNPFFLLLFASSGKESVVEDSEKMVLKRINPNVLKNVLSLLIYAVVFELIAFNMMSIRTLFNSSMSIKSYNVSIADDVELDSNVVAGNNTICVFVDNIDTSISSLRTEIDLYDIDSGKYSYHTDCVVIAYYYDNQTESYEPLASSYVNSSSATSEFIYFDEINTCDKYMIAFVVPEGVSLKIRDIFINPPKPFRINYIRLLVTYLIFVLVYYFGIEKRNAEVNTATMEIHKLKDEFVSSGELRTEAHCNMYNVYNSKNSLYIIFKRFMDILLSGIAIVILLPLFIITAIAIKVEDNGPVFFVQKRAGQNMKTFKMWKFRSMYVNADEKLKELLVNNEQSGHAFKIKDDPRITKVGKFIRKYSIDELPQLFNVFLGDMSIVGPRPILVFQMEECDDYDRQRLLVQPGLTCIWQVSGRANIKWDKWIELDLDYIDTMSALTDIKLILKTIPVVLKGDGAY